MSAKTEAVEPFVVLYAVRYGLPRATYAHGDAIRLIIAHAPVLRQWRGSIVEDIRRTESDGFLMGCTDLRCREEHDRAIAALESGDPSLAEQGRQLASRRDDLIAAGVDPSRLEIPLHPEEPAS